MRQLLLTGLNHSTAPLELRERLALPASRLPEAIEKFRARFNNAEVVFLSTCNRVEVYSATPDGPLAAPINRVPALSPSPSTLGEGGGEGPARPDSSRMRSAVQSPTLDIPSFLADFHNVPRESFASRLYTKQAAAAAEHLFAVAASLDSMVLGETQILGQVREAYDAAHRLGGTGPMLNGLFQRAVAAGKRVMSQTPLVEGRSSAASVAVDFARGVFENFGDKALLCVGTGEMVSLVLQHFSALGPGRVVVLGRDPARATSLALRHHGTGGSLDDLADHLTAADIVISSTAAPQPIITRKIFRDLQRRRRYRPAFMIDLAVPRDIDPSIGKLANVHLYNIDDLQQVVSNTERLRVGAIDAARAILAHHVQEWAAWHRQRELGPAIQRLFERYHNFAKEELRRTLATNAAPDAPQPDIDALARRLVNRMLHEPLRALRSPNLTHDSARYLHALDKLFDLGLDGAPTDQEALTKLRELTRSPGAPNLADEPHQP